MATPRAKVPIRLRHAARSICCWFIGMPLNVAGAERPRTFAAAGLLSLAAALVGSDAGHAGLTRGLAAERFFELGAFDPGLGSCFGGRSLSVPAGNRFLRGVGFGLVDALFE